MATLHVHLPGSGVVSHELPGNQTVRIGWADSNTIQIKEASVSRHHAEVVCEGEAWRLRDLGSANKCRINGAIVTDACFKDGDSLRFGNVEALFLLHPGKTPEVEATLRGCLIVNLPDQGETAYRFEGPLVTIGWKSDNVLRIKDPSISGHHAQFLQVQGKYRLKDLDSTNKTLINGHAIIEAEVNDGDKIQFGSVEGVFRLEYGIRSIKTLKSAPGGEPKLASQIQELQAKIETLQKEREALDFHNKQLSAQLQENAARMEVLKTAEEEREKAQAHARELGKKLEAESARAAEVAQTLTAIQSSQAALQKENERLSAKLEEAQARVGSLEAERSATAQSAQETVAKLGEFQTENTRLQQKLEAVLADTDAKSAAQLELEAQLAAVRSELQKENERLSGERNSLKQELAAAIAKHETASQMGAELAAKLEEAQARVGSLEAERSVAAKSTQETAAKLGEFQTENTRLQQKLEAVLADTDAKSAVQLELEARQAVALAAAQDEAQSARNQLAEVQSQIAALTQERDTLTQQRDALQAAATEATGKWTQAQHQIEGLLREKATAAQALPPRPPPLSLIREGAPAFPAVGAPNASLIEIGQTPTLRIAPPENAPAVLLNPASLETILETAPEVLNGMRRRLHAFIKSQTETRLLDELLADLRELSAQTSTVKLTAVTTLARALEALIDDLMKIPGQINPSTLRTVSQSLDFLVTLLDEKNRTRIKDPYLANLFAVDDDEPARNTIRAAIETVKLKVICAENPKTTLAMLSEQKFDLIFIDVGLPEMNGFELCTRLRKLNGYEKTPVIFITGTVTVQNRVQSSLSGGNDFIAKPFNLLELGVKALIWIFKGQLGLV